MATLSERIKAKMAAAATAAAPVAQPAVVDVAAEFARGYPMAFKALQEFRDGLVDDPLFAACFGGAVPAWRVTRPPHIASGYLVCIASGPSVLAVHAGENDGRNSRSRGSFRTSPGVLTEIPLGDFCSLGYTEGVKEFMDVLVEEHVEAILRKGLIAMPDSRKP